MDEPHYHEAFSAAYARVGEDAFMIYVCADSTLTYARYGDAKGKIIPVAMPVGTVASEDEAIAVITLIGKTPWPFPDGDKSYLTRAEKVAERQGGPGKRIHYSLPDFQFNNQQTVCNVTAMVCDVRDAYRMDGPEKQAAIQQAFTDAHARAGRFFTEEAAAEHRAHQDEAIAAHRAARPKAAG